MDSPGCGLVVAAVALGSTAVYVASLMRRRNQLIFKLPVDCMKGRTAVITGANSGIGRACAAELSAAGATTVLACRDIQSAERVAEGIRQKTKNEVSVLPLDLTSPSSINSFASTFEARHKRCDVLVLNAGSQALVH